MRKIDFISTAPNLAIFKTGTNQTYLGASFFLIYLIILLVLAFIYFYDYFSQNDYSFEYVLAKNDTSMKENEDIIAISNMEYDYEFYLSKDDRGGEKSSKELSPNFLIVDLYKQYIIERGKKYTAKMPTLAVLYRCNGTICDIRKEDKIIIDSYHFHFYIL